jgi:hypothetical protein
LLDQEIDDSNAIAQAS